MRQPHASGILECVPARLGGSMSDIREWLGAWELGAWELGDYVEAVAAHTINTALEGAN